MKRIQLFEFEDFSWFPSWLRDCMTRFIVAMHKLLGSSEDLAALIARALKHTDQKQVLDLCSGGGGPMKWVKDDLQSKHGVTDLKVTLSDLYPHKGAIKKINNDGDADYTYIEEPLNATDVPDSQKGVRTLVCSMHHMNPATAKSILKDAKDDKQPIVVFEISDNSSPKAIWWLAMPINFLMVFFVTPLIRPMTFQQLFFTYVIPLLPFFIAWDGAVSNARTYTQKDWEIVLKDLQSDDYTWETGVIKNKVKKSYLLGHPS